MQKNHDLVDTFDGMELIEVTLLNNVAGAGPIIFDRTTSSDIRCSNKCSFAL